MLHIKQNRSSLNKSSSQCMCDVKYALHSGQYEQPWCLLQLTLCLGESSVCVFGPESSTFSWASHSDKAACLLPLYVIFMDLTLKYSRGLENSQFGDIRVPPLLFFNDVVHGASTNCHFWCSLKWFDVECDAVGTSSLRPQRIFWVHRAHFNCGTCSISIECAIACWLRDSAVMYNTWGCRAI